MHLRIFGASGKGHTRGWATRKRKKLDKLSSKKTCASHAKIGHTLIHHYPSTIPFPLRPRLMMSNTCRNGITVSMSMFNVMSSPLHSCMVRPHAKYIAEQTNYIG